LLILIGGYTISILFDARQEVEIFTLRSQVENVEVSQLEEGGQVRPLDVTRFNLFTKGANRFVLNGAKQITLTEDKTLDQIVNNDCRRFACFQHRIGFEKIPAKLWKGLLGVEDYRFLDHQGVDIVSIMRAIVADIKAMALVQGGSTLTQQLVKNLFLTRKKTLGRKYRELIYSLYLEQVMEKDEILSAYFNEVFWGTFQGVYLKGVYSASLAYFNKRINELDDYESAILISLLKGPYYYKPDKATERLKGRVTSVFKRLVELGLVEKKYEWTQAQWDRWVKDYTKRSNQTYFYSMHLVSKDFQSGISPYEKFIFYESARSLLLDYRKKYEEYDFAVKTIMCQKDCEKQFVFYSKPERKRDKAIFEEKHQVGSVLKPIVYYLFTKFGKNWEEEVDATPITLKLISGKWTPKEASRKGESVYTVKQALQLSKNIPLIRLAQEVGFENLEKELIRFIPHLKTPLGEFPAQLLGAVEMSLGELQFAYDLFFNEVCSDLKSDLYKYEDSVLQHMSEADKTTLRRVSRPWFKNMNVFGKTGTSNDGLDNWFMARSATTFYAIWFGVESQRKDKKVIAGGSTTSFRIFQRFLENRGKRVIDSVCL
jgi:penicillin-binding protein 1B